MKKPQPAPRNSTTKRSAALKTVDEYLAAVPEPVRSTLQDVRAAIRAAALPRAQKSSATACPCTNTKARWLGLPHSRNIAACSGHPSLLKLFKTELSRYDVLKGTIRFPVDEPPPTSLVKKIVKARPAQNDQKKAS
jgi:uncharacterized protein YdhG (YjbR/CyaY superfamily)